MADFEPEDSPCVLVCSTEKESGLCFGCGRSQEEIAQWTLYSKEERQHVLAQLPERLPPLHAKLAERRKLRRTNKRRRTSKTD